MEHVLIQIVAADQGAVRLEYLADLVRLLPPEEIVRLLTHFAAELDKDAQAVQAGLTAGRLYRAHLWLFRSARWKFIFHPLQDRPSDGRVP